MPDEENAEYRVQSGGDIRVSAFEAGGGGPLDGRRYVSIGLFTADGREIGAIAYSDPMALAKLCGLIERGAKWLISQNESAVPVDPNKF